MNNPLVSEVRVNKNGVPVTKHVLATKALAAGKKMLPAPAVKASHVMLAERAVAALEGFGVDLADTHHQGRNLEFAAKYEPKIIDKIVAAVAEAEDDETREEWRRLLGDETWETPEPFRDSDEEASFISEGFHRYRQMVENTGLSMKLFPDASFGLREYKMRGLAQRAEGIMGWMPGDKKYVETQAVMILGTISDYKMNRIAGHGDDIFFIADNMEKIKKVLPELMKRKPVDRGLIELLIKNESSVLTEGVL